MHTPANPLSLARYIATLEGQVGFHGITLSLHNDFAAFADLCDGLPEKSGLTPLFHPDFCELGPARGFWIEGRDRADDVVHVQAVRFDDLRGVNLSTHLEAWLRRVYCRGPKAAVPEDTGLTSAPIACAITGRLCYHGEMWLRSRYRGRGLSAPLSQLAHSLALAKWSPDFIYGFVDPGLVEKGIAAQYGYMHMQPGGALWSQAPGHYASDEWLVWLSREDLTFLVEHRLAHPDSARNGMSTRCVSSDRQITAGSPVPP